jgi:hypothetical protein
VQVTGKIGLLRSVERTWVAMRPSGAGREAEWKR